MRLATAPALHLSNREVLDHFLTLKQANDRLQSLISTRSARSAAKALEQYPLKGDDDIETVDFGDETPDEDVAERRGISEELVWVQDQVIRYLCGELNSTARQTEEGVARLADELQDHELTKAEVLQICNLVPVLPVELYCIIEEADERFRPDPSGRLEVIVSQIQSTLLDVVPPELEQFAIPPPTADESDGSPAVGHVKQDGALVGLEEELVHEPEWGHGREDGVGEEKEGDMD